MRLAIFEDRAALPIALPEGVDFDENVIATNMVQYPTLNSSSCHPQA